MLPFVPALALATVALASSASAINTAQSGKIVQLTSATNFCLLLPSTSGQTIGDSEGSAVAYCEGTQTDGSRTLPSGGITGAHYVATDDYVQITGTLDGTVLGLATGDDGGQYDNAPKGSEPYSGCSNYNNQGAFLSLVSSGTFCIRCCKSDNVDSGPCNVHNDLDGCASNIPGDYSSGSFTNDGTASDSNSSSSSSTEAATKATSTTATSTSTATSTTTGTADIGGETTTASSSATVSHTTPSASSQTGSSNPASSSVGAINGAGLTAGPAGVAAAAFAVAAVAVANGL